ncbi:symmetrical bis(5'-nucleosyl)-tetraphosphatase [Rhodoferax sp.]|uniref:symmetrical bis(5'-nucleosyl)-tetraphosphatase n=1 Tax=Rhodoferax sp. TaxID=50421 RepID=UPI002747ECFD|nr:symmetrical bis(5'-nucleosyl)-tetraphosphatase [Rhodoferax sp.]
MSVYLVGDIQGCDAALQQLLCKIGFSPSRDTLYLLGDLVNRGPDSAGVLRRLMGFGSSAKSLLGNHDLHLIALAHDLRKPHRNDTLGDILNAPDCHAMVEWLRGQSMAMLTTIHSQSVLMVHAGVLPCWSASQTLALAQEVEAVLRGDGLVEFLQDMYGDEPNRWNDSLSGPARLRVIVNALTRLRFCTSDGAMEFTAKDGVDATPSGHYPWFDAPQRRTADITVAFGHWSTLGWLDRPDLIALDTGCVWGGCLSAVRLGQASGTGGLARELIQVQCSSSQTPKSGLTRAGGRIKPI